MKYTISYYSELSIKDTLYFSARRNFVSITNYRDKNDLDQTIKNESHYGDKYYYSCFLDYYLDDIILGNFDILCDNRNNIKLSMYGE